MASNRVHYLRKHTYTTRSNKIRKVRTPGGRLTVQYIKKTAKGPQTSIAGRGRISGLKKMSNADYSRATPNSRRISRAYGGVITPEQLKEKILRAFLIEEVNVIKRIVRAQKAEKQPHPAHAHKDKHLVDLHKPKQPKEPATHPFHKGHAHHHAHGGHHKAH